MTGCVSAASPRELKVWSRTASATDLQQLSFADADTVGEGWQQRAMRRSLTCPSGFRLGHEAAALEPSSTSMESASAEEPQPQPEPRSALGGLRRRFRLMSLKSETGSARTPSASPVVTSDAGDDDATSVLAQSSSAVRRLVRVSSTVELLEANESLSLAQTPQQASRKCGFLGLSLLTASSASVSLGSRSPGASTAAIDAAAAQREGEDAKGGSGPFLLPGVATRKVRMALPVVDGPSSSTEAEAGSSSATATGPGGRRFASVQCLATPSSTRSAAAYRYVLTPTTPDLHRDGFRLVDDELDIVFFDFDGTLTATPGESATQHGQKKAELKERADMLRPRLQGMIDAGLLLGIMSKSTENTIREALEFAELTDLFQGPIVGKALDFEGKAGIIAKMHQSGKLSLGEEGLSRVLLVDDDVRELDRCRDHGIQTFAAPEGGGLLDSDFDEIFVFLTLPSPSNSP